MTIKLFRTPQDAESAFYSALEQRSLEEMMSVWAKGMGVICIHPNGPRLVGHEKVRESWRMIFTSELQLHFELRNRQCVEGTELAMHVVNECVSIEGRQQNVVVVATNIYQQTEQGWKMILHHASPAPEASAEEPRMMDRKLH